MNKKGEGENLIFLISQSRAGSMMSQRIPGSYSNIYTVSEPWILLGPLYPLHFDNFDAECNTRLFKVARQNFFQQLLLIAKLLNLTLTQGGHTFIWEKLYLNCKNGMRRSLLTNRLLS